MEKRTTVWEYNEKNLPVKIRYLDGFRDEETDSFTEEESYTQVYTYDEDGHPVREDILLYGEAGGRFIREYDVFGNQIWECYVDADTEDIPADKEEDITWEYEYHYTEK